MSSIYDAWDNGDRPAIRKRFARLEEITRMAQQAGIRVAGPMDSVDPKNIYAHELERFAALVAAAEREAILLMLKGIDQTDINSPDGWWETSKGAEFGAGVLAAIRARGQA